MDPSSARGERGALLGRESEVEGCAAIHDRLGPDGAAVALDDFLDDREADAGALEILAAVQPLEDAEEPAVVLHVEADAIVLHEINGRVLVRDRADLDLRLLASRGELDRVRDE